MKESTFNLCKFGMLIVKYKHDMDPNSNINYRRKIPLVPSLAYFFASARSDVVNLPACHILYGSALAL